MVEINVGDFVIWTSWQIYCERVTKVTPRRVYSGANYTRCIGKEKIKFCGPKVVASKLAEQLTSSLAQYRQDTKAAGIRHTKRTEEALAKANEVMQCHTS